jgi:hypothetical protein
MKYLFHYIGRTYCIFWRYFTILFFNLYYTEVHLQCISHFTTTYIQTINFTHFVLHFTTLYKLSSNFTHFGISVWHIPDAVCTVSNSWWQTERPSEVCRVIFNKLDSCASSWFYYRNTTIRNERLCGFPLSLFVWIVIQKNASVYNFTPYNLRNWHRAVKKTKERPAAITQCRRKLVTGLLRRTDGRTCLLRAVGSPIKSSNSCPESCGESGREIKWWSAVRESVTLC